MPPKYVNIKTIMQFLLQAEKLTFPLPTSQSYCLGPSTGCPQLMYFTPYVLVIEDFCKSKAEHDYTVWFMPELNLAYTTNLQTQFRNQHLYETFFCFFWFEFIFPYFELQAVIRGSIVAASLFTFVMFTRTFLPSK